jgi:hypothetical protein
LGLAITEFVCSTHKKIGVRDDAIDRDRGVKNMRRIGIVAVAVTERLDGSSRGEGEADVLDSMRRDPAP